ncbi:CsbD family protein [Streptomyces sp. NPDC060027]|uniref:CsbD family protein n=1 Tax=Streptomyces sp. NPDC060027 TaxID=3347040 RepID=UPI00367BF4FC
MSVGRTVKNRTQEIKGRISEVLGRVTRNRKLERKGKAERVSGNLRQAGEKARRAFRR